MSKRSVGRTVLLFYGLITLHFLGSTLSRLQLISNWEYRLPLLFLWFAEADITKELLWLRISHGTGLSISLHVGVSFAN
jgi:hypothetical protein